MKTICLVKNASKAPTSGHVFGKTHVWPAYQVFGY